MQEIGLLVRQSDHASLDPIYETLETF